MTAPFWLLIFVWDGGAIEVSEVPMPSLEVCLTAIDELPTYMGTTVRGACIPGGAS